MLLVVNYHYIRPQFPGQGIHGETPAQFRDQLERLAKIGTFTSAWALREGVKSERIPDRKILITFDDGLREQYDYALPILHEMGIPAIFFVNTQPIVESTVLDVHKLHLLLASGWTWNVKSAQNLAAQLKYPYDEPWVANLKYRLNVKRDPLMQEIVADGFAAMFDEAEVSRELYMSPRQIAALPEVGTHGHTHENPEERYVESACYISRWTDRHVYALSYPFGNRAACVEIYPSEGFDLGFTMERGVNSDLARPLLLGRISCADLPDEGPLDKLWDLPRCVWS